MINTENAGRSIKLWEIYIIYQYHGVHLQKYLPFPLGPLIVPDQTAKNFKEVEFPTNPGSLVEELAQDVLGIFALRELGYLRKLFSAFNKRTWIPAMLIIASL